MQNDWWHAQKEASITSPGTLNLDVSPLIETRQSPALGRDLILMGDGHRIIFYQSDASVEFGTQVQSYPVLFKSVKIH